MKLGSSSTWYRVASVTSDTELELTAAFFQTTASGAASVAATVTPVDEKDLSRTDLASAHLVIFGSEESSSLITEMAVSPTAPFNLPARVLEDQITLAGEVFLVPEHGVWMTYPNPLAPGRLVVLGHNVIGDTAGLTDMVFWVHEAWPWFWP